MIVVFVGPPGAGKSTQAALLSQRCQVPRLEMGEILRELSAQDTPLGREIRDYVDRGLLVPDRIIKQVVADHLRRPEFQRGFIIDGFPRNLEQARIFDEMLRTDGKEVGAVVVFEITERMVLERLSRRRACPNCGTPYKVGTGLAASESHCKKCGSRLSQRRDDRPEVIRARLNIYARETAPLIAYYDRHHVRTIRVDASRSIEEVFSSLEAAIPCDP